MRKFIFTVLIILVATATRGQDFTSSKAERDIFLNKALSQLSIKAKIAPTDQLQKIREKAAKWQQTNAKEDWIEVTDAIYKAAKSSHSKSEVTFATSRGNGAKVKYQTLGQRMRNETPTTTREPTLTVESMYIGTYHIWSERDESPTSNKDDEFNIVGPKAAVTLQENK